MAKNMDNVLLEIHKSLTIANYCTRNMGLPISNNGSVSLLQTLFNRAIFIVTFFTIAVLLIAQAWYLVSTASLEESIATIHVAGYGVMSFGKLLTLWYKRTTFQSLLKELTDLWPADADEEIVQIKQQRLSRLRFVQICYAVFNTLGLTFFILNPFIFFTINKSLGKPATLTHIWHTVYPLDTTQTSAYVCVIIYEIYAGIVCVLAVLGSDILFMTMSSHVSMLLDFLQQKICRIASSEKLEKNDAPLIDCYEDIKQIIRIHQRLISYGNDLEDAFCAVNLINVLLSSVNICFAAFTILLEPLMELSNKCFLCSMLTEVGIICWYSQEISTASTGIAEATAKCKWYHTNIRCRKALLILMHRSQKPLHFTAYKFSPITMATYTSILANSYSYFMLLHTIYKQ